MTDVTINANRDPVSGKLRGSYEPVAEGVNFIGTIAHGNTLTITDSLARFGTRTNVKPLFVNFADSRNGNVLGRISAQHLSSDATIDATIKSGSLAGSIKFDIKQFGTAGVMSAPITTQYQTKPLIQYIERRYDFDYANPRIQNNVYYFSVKNYANTDVFQFVIDGRTYTHTNDGTAGSISNGATVRANLIAAINADGLCKCTAAEETGTIRLTKKVETDYFDVTYSTSIYQNFNNKHARIWSWNDATINNARMSTINATSEQLVTENTTGSTSGYYNPKLFPNEWRNEELVLKNSTAADTPDGFYGHYKNGELLNPVNSLVTYNAGQQPLGRCYLNQFSNGPYGYWQSELIMRLGYQCWDDEYNAIYIADAENIVAGTTTLVRQPQTFWNSDRVKIKLTESLVSVAGAYVHVRTGLDSYVYLGRLPA